MRSSVESETDEYPGEISFVEPIEDTGELVVTEVLRLDVFT